MILDVNVELSGTMLAELVSIRMMSAFLPTSIEPISSSRPKVSAPFIVPIAIASSESKTLGSKVETF